MRLFYILTFLFGISSGLVAQSLFLSEPEPVAEATFGNKAPRIALLGDGTPIAYLGKAGAAPELYVVRRETDGWSTPVSIPIGDLDVNLWGNTLGPQIATHANTIFVVFEVYGSGIFVCRSTDGGLSFDPPASVVDLPAGRYATLPTIACDLNGNPLVGFITTNASEQDAQYEVVQSPDGGDFWLDPVVANGGIAGDEVCECCSSGISVDEDGVIYVSYRNNMNNIRDMWVVRSTDGGATFTDPTDVDDTDWEVFLCPGSGPHSIPAGPQLLTTFFSAGEGTSSVYVSSMDRTSMSVTGQWKMSGFEGGTGNQNFPRIAGSGDTLAVAWEESVTSLSKEAVISWSVSGPEGLQSEPILLSGGQFAQGNPDLVYRNGVFHIVYFNQMGNQIFYRQGSFDPPVAVEEPSAVSQLQVYPNPTDNQLFIHFSDGYSGPVSLRLFDLAGRDVHSRESFGPDISVSVEKLSAGIYFLEVQTDQGLVTERVRIQ